MIEKGNYGPVHVVDGKFKGKKGIYDSDISHKGKKKAIVYLDEVEEYKMIPYEKLERIHKK